MPNGKLSHRFFLGSILFTSAVLLSSCGNNEDLTGVFGSSGSSGVGNASSGTTADETTGVETNGTTGIPNSSTGNMDTSGTGDHGKGFCVDGPVYMPGNTPSTNIIIEDAIFPWVSAEFPAVEGGMEWPAQPIQQLDLNSISNLDLSERLLVIEPACSPDPAVKRLYKIQNRLESSLVLKVFLMFRTLNPSKDQVFYAWIPPKSTRYLPLYITDYQSPDYSVQPVNDALQNAEVNFGAGNWKFDDHLSIGFYWGKPGLGLLIQEGHENQTETYHEGFFENNIYLNALAKNYKGYSDFQCQSYCEYNDGKDPW